MEKLLDNTSKIEQNNNKSLTSNLDRFIKVIELNDINAFFWNYDEEYLKDNFFNINFWWFKSDLSIYYSVMEIEQDSPYKQDIINLANYVDKIFNWIKSWINDIKEVFKNDEDKQNFYKLLKTYLGDNFVPKLKEVQGNSPKYLEKMNKKQKEEEKNWVNWVKVLSQEEIEALLDWK